MRILEDDFKWFHDIWAPIEIGIDNEHGTMRFKTILNWSLYG